MQLKEYKIKNNLTLQKIADSLGISGANPRRTVSRYIDKTRTPRLQIAKQIVLMTNGEVTLEDLGVKNGQEKST
jgi:predicted transcriptional regulator